MIVKKENIPSVWDKKKQEIFFSIDGLKCFVGLEKVYYGCVLDGSWFQLLKDENIIGYGWITNSNIDDPIYPYPEISLCIHRDYQSQGAGKFLFIELMALVKQNEKGVQILIKRENTEYKKVVKMAMILGFRDFETFPEASFDEIITSMMDPIILGMEF